MLNVACKKFVSANNISLYKKHVISVKIVSAAGFIHGIRVPTDWNVPNTGMSLLTHRRNFRIATQFWSKLKPEADVLKKRCSENMQQIYRRTRMPKCDFKLYWNRTSAWVFSCTFAAHFQNTFPQEHLWVAAYVKPVP